MKWIKRLFDVTICLKCGRKKKLYRGLGTDDYFCETCCNNSDRNMITEGYHKKDGVNHGDSKIKTRPPKLAPLKNKVSL